MKKYVVINVQGCHDVSTKIFHTKKDLRQYLEYFLEDGEDEPEYCAEDLIPCGQIYGDGQMLKVIEV